MNKQQGYAFLTLGLSMLSLSILINPVLLPMAMAFIVIGSININRKK